MNMKCEDICKYIPIYIDGEFSERENVEIESHIQECTHCKQVLDSEHQLKNLIKNHVSMIQTPRIVRENIINKIRSEETFSERFSMRKLLYFSVSASAALAAVLIFVFIGTKNDFSKFTENMISSHEDSTGNQIFGNYQSVESFLKAKSPFPVNIPIKESDEVTLLGARLVRYQDQPAVLFMYKYRDKNLSVIGYPGSGEVMGSGKNIYFSPKSRYVNIDHKRGYSIATFQEKGVNHSLVGDVNDNELLGLIPASY
jgi:mycothiol system anti-sigma-R factor